MWCRNGDTWLPDHAFRVDELQRRMGEAEIVAVEVVLPRHLAFWG
jgi:hypothetical protein